MVFCKECKYCDSPKMQISACLHVKAIVNTSVVTGMHKHYSCETMRDISGNCGPQATLFCPREK